MKVIRTVVEKVRKFLRIPEELVLQEIERPRRFPGDIVRVHKKYLDITYEDELGRILVMKRWLRLCTTFKQALWALKNTLGPHTEMDSPDQRLAVRKCLGFCVSLKQAEEVLANTPYGSNSERLATLKCLSFCSTRGKIVQFIDRVSHREESVRLAEEKLSRLLLKQVRRAKTPRQIIRLWEDAPVGSEADRMITVKWDNLSLRQVQKARTPKQIRKAFFDARPNSPARSSAIKKLAKMRSTLPV